MDLSFLDVRPGHATRPSTPELARRELVSRRHDGVRLAHRAHEELSRRFGPGLRLELRPDTRTPRPPVRTHYEWCAEVTFEFHPGLRLLARLVTHESFLWFDPRSPDRLLLDVTLTYQPPSRWFERIFRAARRPVPIRSRAELYRLLSRHAATAPFRLST